MRAGQSGKDSAPQPLVKAAGIARKCCVIGAGDHVEIWAEERWDEYNAVSDEAFEEAAESLTEFLR